MDTTPLRTAFDAFLEAAVSEPRRAPGGWDAGSIVAHVTINNRLIAAHIARVLAKEPRPYDNIPAQSELLLRAVIASNIDRLSLLEAARRSCEEVLAMAELVEDDSGAIEQHVLVLDGDHTSVDGDVSVADVLSIQARIHLPAHAEQLRRLVRGSSPERRLEGRPITIEQREGR